MRLYERQGPPVCPRPFGHFVRYPPHSRARYLSSHIDTSQVIAASSLSVTCCAVRPVVLAGVRVVAGLAHCLPVLPLPEERPIALVRGDVVDDGGEGRSREPAVRRALAAWMLREEACSSLLPLRAVAALVGGGTAGDCCLTGDAGDLGAWGTRRHRLRCRRRTRCLPYRRSARGPRARRRTRVAAGG
jgi:hypothetical protein